MSGARDLTVGRVSAPEPTLTLVRAALGAIYDPEIPTVSIVDLGLVHDARVQPDGTIAVDLLPTFVACPALEVIRSTVADALSALGRPVAVEFVRTVPWTTDLLTDAGRAGLKAAGIAPPSALEDVRCAYCDSPDVAMDSAFGPTLCRSLFYCRTCRQPFEAFKPV